MKKLFVVTGEVSGDLLASELLLRLREIFTDLEIAGWGGDHMRRAGVEVYQDTSKSSVMGLWSVVQKAAMIKKQLAQCKADIVKFDPDIILYVDYGGFNMRIAQWSHGQAYRNIYFIPPKVWAWNSGRVEKLRRYFDRIITVFPFESDWYVAHDLTVDYIQHPLIDILAKSSAHTSIVSPVHRARYAKVIAVLPGSRVQEIKATKSVLLEAMRECPNTLFLVSSMAQIAPSLYDEFRSLSNVQLAGESSYDLLKSADMAWITSGTASLEAALLGVPHLVMYKTDYLMYTLARLLVRLRFISLPNIILDEAVIPELIQGNVTVPKLMAITSQILEDQANQQIERFSRLRSLMTEESIGSKLKEIFEL